MKEEGKKNKNNKRKEKRSRGEKKVKTDRQFLMCRINVKMQWECMALKKKVKNIFFKKLIHNENAEFKCIG